MTTDQKLFFCNFKFNHSVVAKVPFILFGSITEEKSKVIEPLTWHFTLDEAYFGECNFLQQFSGDFRNFRLLMKYKSCFIGLSFRLMIKISVKVRYTMLHLPLQSSILLKPLIRPQKSLLPS